MKFEANEREELAKIGVYSLLDLALVLPKSFESSFITSSPRQGVVCVEAEILTLRRASGGMLIATAFCQTWECEIKLVIFHAKPWHYGAFKPHKELILNGTCAYAYGAWQIANPKIITKTGVISPKFRRDMKDERLKKLIKKYITNENLRAEGLNENEISFLVAIQKGDEDSISLLNLLKNGEVDTRVIKFIEIFNYIKKLNSKKLYFKNQKIEPFDINEWLKNLPFTPTNDQLNAINDIRQDMSSTQAKRRVIMGDVGSGKTLVILGAALSAYPNKSILMAPTSILANQLYEEACRLLPDFMNVVLVKSGEKEPDLANANLIIGTHVLLYTKLPKSVLVMVDEQHRFGSAQRNKVEELVRDGERSATFVQFSATPIPRTLTMINSSLVSYSFLKEIPFKKNIHTQVIKSADFGAFMAHLRSEISNHRQAVIVYPLVESSEVLNYQSLSEASDFWLQNFKNVYITHGKDKQKDEILLKFKEDGDLLLATTIVEVGISLPRLSTILIVGAERLGLATLHQLRGRVGRNGGDGYCFLFTKLKQTPSRLIEFAQTLDGFKIAELDLKNRQSGDILDGSVQHGATFEYYEYEEDITKAAQDRLKALRIL
ncbi:ATP-dependent DNA helicase RecG [Campylobacter sp. RM9344]|uniref:ATP-dependent DNA helicase RecG n=1 Tax=Campylobacter californiensis TaxID=1032243 RepID=A0AAW3ZWY1_9BACT|nr:MULTISPECIES: ATP-dependent DNA helicase RecG [unclassified Campylobacter]MBE2984815.1 ATP-dependent DNA helicase RecG [Campylobacter sp. RM6883]MBE2994719.1 ATP-dependent DNA helicase RecG [Campylobacter sp. RM6913]MBE3029585.1 ATP-dependent DNA helicase RecG [Campylobacter sp. RM9344]MBE3608339.1 ATP-dependent DNA helicase RecG [Campylobacter sp. RM9337]QCD50528.1 ATP-dependent DNA helicase [Campylobacter sp. RM6914]